MSQDCSPLHATILIMDPIQCGVLLPRMNRRFVIQNGRLLILLKLFAKDVSLRQDLLDRPSRMS